MEPETATITRTGCLFYGFHYLGGMLMDSEGNQCALITSSYSPCRMERRKQKTDWKLCEFNPASNKVLAFSPSVIEEILTSATICPKELWPEGASSWKGISFRNWYEHIVNGKEL